MAGFTQNVLNSLTGGVNLVLGDVVFEGFEIPERISVPSDQQLVVHKLLGGKRKIDAMGQDPAPISWSGRFRGANAESRAQHLALLAAEGKPLSLTWNSYRFTVVISSFTPKYQQAFEIPYSIVCEVEENQSIPILASIPGLPLSIVNDISTATTIASSLGITSITTAMTSLQSQFNTTSLTGATTATGQQLQSSIAPIQSTVETAVTSNNAVLAPTSAGTGLAGLVSGANAVQGAAALLNAASASTALGQLLPLASTLVRMSTNAGNLGL